MSSVRNGFSFGARRRVSVVAAAAAAAAADTPESSERCGGSFGGRGAGGGASQRRFRLLRSDSTSIGRQMAGEMAGGGMAGRGEGLIIVIIVSTCTRIQICEVATCTNMKRKSIFNMFTNANANMQIIQAPIGPPTTSSSSSSGSGSSTAYHTTF